MGLIKSIKRLFKKAEEKPSPTIKNERHKIDDKTREKIENLLLSKFNGHLKCDCSNDNWIMGNFLIDLPQQGFLTIHTTFISYLNVVCVCDNCGQTKLFNARLLELVDENGELVK